MNFADRIEQFAKSDGAQALARLRRQAEERANANGIDKAFAASEAERLYWPGCSHEEVVTAAAGPFRRAA